MTRKWNNEDRPRRSVTMLPVLLAGVGAAIWLALRPGKDAGVKAHRADGSDDSKSFGAGIADEGTIPDTAANPSF